MAEAHPIPEQSSPIQASPQAFNLRYGVDADKDTCYAIHRAAMHDLIDKVWGWDEEAQRGYFKTVWNQCRVKVVVVDGAVVGNLIVEYQPTKIWLRRIELDPLVQGRGIGTALVKGLQDEATNLHQPLALNVIVINTRAKALYERVGFRLTDHVDEEGHKLGMQWDPPSNSEA